MSHPGWGLLTIGASLTAIGLAWLLAPSIPWWGKLPGDITIEQDKFRFHFPLTSCLLLSLLVTSVVWLLKHFMKS